MRRFLLAFCAIIVCTFFTNIVFGQVNMSATGSVSQDFNTLITTGSATFTDNSTIPNWYSQRTGTGTTIVADTGASNAGNLYSYGSASATDRGLGTLGSGNAAVGSFAHGILLRNTSGGTITDIKVSYTLEQWRNSAATAQAISVYYKTSSTPITALNPNSNATWTAVPSANLNSPITGGTAAALDGNLAANRVSASNISLPSLSLANNDYIMIKWDDPDHAGTDHGLAIDDVTISYTVPPPTVNLSVSTNSASEAGATAVTVTATASSAVSGAQTVDLGVSGTRITAGDYTLSPTTITIPNGGTTGTATFTVVDDAIYEGSEAATITMSNPSSGITLGATTSQNITITDNDTAPTLAIDSVTQAETNSGTTNFVFTVTKTGATELTSNVNFATADVTATAGTDYSSTSGSLTFLATDTTKTITVSVNGDTIVEPNETFTVDLSSPISSTITTGTGIGTITNDDTPQTVNLSVSTNSATEAGATSVTVTVTASAPVSGAQTVDLAVTGTGITAGDYTLSPTTVTIADGSTTGTATFTVVDDAIEEIGGETATITMSNPSSGITLGGTTSQNITIADNDTPIDILSTNTLTSGNTNIPYNFTFTTTGGVAPYTYALANATTLPPGLNLSSAGVLSGTPTSAGTFTFDVTVTDSNPFTNATEMKFFNPIRRFSPNAANTKTETFTITINAPTAAGSLIKGRLVTPNGRGLSNALVMLTDLTTGETRSVRSSAFGYFTFEDCASGHFYIIDVPSKKYRFNQTSFTLNGDLDDLVLTANP